MDGPSDRLPGSRRGKSSLWVFLEGDDLWDGVGSLVSSTGEFSTGGFFIWEWGGCSHGMFYCLNLAEK